MNENLICKYFAKFYEHISIKAYNTIERKKKAVLNMFTNYFSPRILLLYRKATTKKKKISNNIDINASASPIDIGLSWY